MGNMLGLASSLGCPDATAQCLCNNINFSYGIRDCSVQHCQDMNLANTVIAYGSAYCSCKFLSSLGFVYMFFCGSLD